MEGEETGEWLPIAVIEGDIYHFSYSIIQTSVTWLSQLKSGVKPTSLIWYLTWVTITLFP